MLLTVHRPQYSKIEILKSKPKSKANKWSLKLLEQVFRRQPAQWQQCLCRTKQVAQNTKKFSSCKPKQQTDQLLVALQVLAQVLPSRVVLEPGLLDLQDRAWELTQVSSSSSHRWRYMQHRLSRYECHFRNHRRVLEKSFRQIQQVVKSRYTPQEMTVQEAMAWLQQRINFKPNSFRRMGL